MVASLAGVKSKLDIPESVTTLDAAINPALYAAREYFFDLTGYRDEVTTGQVDTFENVQLGRRLQLTRRPVSVVTSVQGRVIGKNATFQAVDYDLVNAEKGVLRLIGTDLQAFPPQEARPSWFRWRDYRWPIVKVTYDVLAAPLKDDFWEAIEATAALWYELGLVGADQSVSAGGVSKSYDKRALPPHITGVLFRHMREVGSWQ